MSSATSFLSGQHSLIRLKNLQTVKLDWTNYFAWKAQVITLLRGNGLLPLIESATTEDNDDILATQQDQLLLGWIYSMISPLVLPQFAPYTTSFYVWTALSGIFNARLRARVLQVKNRLSNFKKENHSVDDYLTELTRLMEEVREVGVALDDGELTLIALNGLDSTYESFVTAQLARVDDISFAFFQGLLWSHEERFSKNSAIIGMFHMANAVSTDSIFGNTITCQICLKKGHSAIACFNRHNESRFPTVVDKKSRFRPRQSQGLKQGNNINSVWYPDSGATDHVSPQSSDIQKKDSTPSAANILTANILTANGNGASVSHFSNSYYLVGKNQLVLKDILHVRGIKKKLLSVRKLCEDNDFSVTFNKSDVYIKDCKIDDVVLAGEVADGLYQIQILFLDVWHARLGHCNKKITRKIVSDSSLPISANFFKDCDSCIIGKAHQSSYPSKVNNIALKPLELLFADVWGPAPMNSVFGSKYYILFVDKSTKYNWIFPIQQKSQVKETFIKFKTQVELFFDRKIRAVQSDNSGEFIALKDFFSTVGITHRRLCPHIHQQMGTVERRHRHIVDIGIALLHHAKLPMEFWYFAFTTATFLYNRVPTESLARISPYEALFSEAPNLIGLKVFGSKAFPNLRPYYRQKFAPRLKPHVFLGYPREHDGYVCFIPSTRKIIVSKDVTFFEESFDCNPKLQLNGTVHSTRVVTNSVDESYPDLTKLDNIDHILSSQAGQSNVSPSDTISPSSSATDSASQTTESSSIAVTEVHDTATLTDMDPPEISGHRMITRAHSGIAKPNPKYIMQISPGPSVPSRVKAALTDPTWVKAMSDELSALDKNNTWSLVERNDQMNVLSSKWVFKHKLDDKGQIIRHKARLVAVGSNQRDGIDFSEMFAPVVKLATIRIILSVVVTKGWKLRQSDVSNTFLHGVLDENIYMRQLPRFVDKAQNHHVCKFRKSIYGLRQSPRAWFFRLRDFLLSIHFKESQAD